MKVKIYEEDESNESIKNKCKEFLLKYPNEVFDVSTLTLTVISLDIGYITATCSYGDQCCYFTWESIDEFLEDYKLHPYQDVIEE